MYMIMVDMGMSGGAGDAMSNGTFCEGAGMNAGFSTPGSEMGACIVFIFENWVLDTPGKYAFAVVGTFFLAMLPELLIWLRQKRILTLRRERRKARFLAYVTAYFVQIVVLYWLMLIVMMYSTYLFLAVICGVTTAHMLLTDPLSGKGNCDEDCLNPGGNGSDSMEQNLLKA